MPQLKAEHPISAFALSLLVTAVQCQQSVNCIESELSSHFLNASTEGGTTPTKLSFPLYGRATCVGDRRQTIWGFNTVDITRAKICSGGLGIGIICGEKGRIIFPGFWSINRPSRARPLSHVHCLVRCTVPSQCNAQSLWCSPFLNASTESRRPDTSLCSKSIGHCSAMSAVSEMY